MHHPTNRITHTMAFVTPVVEHWLEREIAQWVQPMKDWSDDPSHHERTLLPRSYISLLKKQRHLHLPLSFPFRLGKTPTPVMGTDSWLCQTTGVGQFITHLCLETNVASSLSVTNPVSRFMHCLVYTNKSVSNVSYLAIIIILDIIN